MIKQPCLCADITMYTTALKLYHLFSVNFVWMIMIWLKKILCEQQESFRRCLSVLCLWDVGRACSLAMPWNNTVCTLYKNRVALQEVWAQMFSDHPEKQSTKSHEASSESNMCAEVLDELCIHFSLCCFTILVTLKHKIWNKTFNQRMGVWVDYCAVKTVVGLLAAQWASVHLLLWMLMFCSVWI